MLGLAEIIWRWFQPECFHRLSEATGQRSLTRRSICQAASVKIRQLEQSFMNSSLLHYSTGLTGQSSHSSSSEGTFARFFIQCKSVCVFMYVYVYECVCGGGWTHSEEFQGTECPRPCHPDRQKAAGAVEGQFGSPDRRGPGWGLRPDRTGLDYLQGSNLWETRSAASDAASPSELLLPPLKPVCEGDSEKVIWKRSWCMSQGQYFLPLEQLGANDPNWISITMIVCMAYAVLIKYRLTWLTRFCDRRHPVRSCEPSGTSQTMCLSSSLSSLPGETKDTNMNKICDCGRNNLMML